MPAKIIRCVVLSTLLAVTALSGRYLLREHRADVVYQHATRGEAERQITNQLGDPDETLSCGPYLWWNGDQTFPAKDDNKCRKWVRYNFFLHAFAFGYSTDGKLVSRYEYSSE